MRSLRFCLALLLTSSAFAAPPGWLGTAAQAPAGAAVGTAPAQVLVEEVTYAVQPNGRVLEEHRRAVRVLNRSGRSQAVGSVIYVDKGDFVRETGAWLLRAGKEVKPPQKRDWADLSSAAAGAVYDETRTRSISFTDLALDGDVFGFSTRVDRSLLFAHIAFEFGGWLPTARERAVLQVPPGWSCEYTVTGQRAKEVLVTRGADTWSWELGDEPYRPDEPAIADGARTDARVVVHLVPPVAAGKNAPVTLRTWAEVADWDLRNAHGQCDTNPALAAEAKRLTAGCADPLARIRALTRHVQQLRYVAVHRGLALGMGYRPRKATEVLAKGWGDCKDKANLLCALLREVGIEAYSASARIGEGRLVDPEWPSVQQFNHAIAAIRVDASVDLPSVVEVPGLGRLLVFDATEPDVVVGDLPLPLQGSRIHVLAPGNNGLTTLPVLPVESRHLFDRRVRLELVGGGVVGECSFGGPGRAGAGVRFMERTKSEKELRDWLGAAINETVRGAKIAEFAATGDALTGERRLAFGFSAPRFGQQLAGGLTLLRLDILSRDSVPSFPVKERRLPIGLRPVLQRDLVTLPLPAGVVVDEMPPRSELSSPYGSYSSVVEVAEGAVVVRRELRLVDREVPVSEYEALRKFLSDVAKADRSAVVLRQAVAAAK